MTTTGPTVISKVRDLIETNELRGLWLPSVKISKAPDRGNNPGCLYLKNAEGQYLGRVTRENELRTMAPLSQAVKDELRVVAVGGLEALNNLGILCGSCCYCGKELTDPDSVDRGYGPVCAKKYNLEHPNRHGF